MRASRMQAKKPTVFPSDYPDPVLIFILRIYRTQRICGGFSDLKSGGWFEQDPGIKKSEGGNDISEQKGSDPGPP
jgi:hypothetical protein